jgi:hypothetical protein
MAPRKHYAKSQELVYKKIGQGSRERYKLVHADRPTNKGSVNAERLAGGAQPSAAPIVSPPTGAAEGMASDDFQFDGGQDNDIPDRTGRKGKKVRRAHWHL